MAQSVKSLGFSSGGDLTVREIEPCIRLSAAPPSLATPDLLHFHIHLLISLSILHKNAVGIGILLNLQIILRTGILTISSLSIHEREMALCLRLGFSTSGIFTLGAR